MLASERDPVYEIWKKPRKPMEYDRLPIPCHHDTNGIKILALLMHDAFLLYYNPILQAVVLGSLN